MIRKFKKVRAGIRQRWIHAINDRHLDKLADDVKKHSKLRPQRPIVFMGVSTRLQGMSLNAGFALLTKWSLQLQGVPVIQFICDAGMDHCMLGSILNHPLDSPPCAICIRQSKRMYSQLDVVWYKNRPSTKIKNEINDLSIKQLSMYQYRGASFRSFGSARHTVGSPMLSFAR